MRLFYWTGIFETHVGKKSEMKNKSRTRISTHLMRRDLAVFLAQSSQELEHFNSILNPGIYDASARRKRLPEATDKGESGVIDFYNRRSVLITGATGFIGRMVNEKFILTCTL